MGAQGQSQGWKPALQQLHSLFAQSEMDVQDMRKAVSLVNQSKPAVQEGSPQEVVDDPAQRAELLRCAFQGSGANSCRKGPEQELLPPRAASQSAECMPRRPRRRHPPTKRCRVRIASTPYCRLAAGISSKIARMHVFTVGRPLPSDSSIPVELEHVNMQVACEPAISWHAVRRWREALCRQGRRTRCRQGRRTRCALFYGASASWFLHSGRHLLLGCSRRMRAGELGSDTLPQLPLPALAVDQAGSQLIAIHRDEPAAAPGASRVFR